MAPKTQTGIPASVIAEQIDELGALEKRVLPFRADLTRIEQLRKAVRGHFDASPASEPFEARGARFTALIGARAEQRSVNPLKLIKAIGLKLYASLCTPTLAALEANVSADVIANVVTSAPTGARSVKTFERAS